MCISGSLSLSYLILVTPGVYCNSLVLTFVFLYLLLSVHFFTPLYTAKEEFALQLCLFHALAC